VSRRFPFLPGALLRLVGGPQQHVPRNHLRSFIRIHLAVVNLEKFGMISGTRQSATVRARGAWTKRACHTIPFVTTPKKRTGRNLLNFFAHETGASFSPLRLHPVALRTVPFEKLSTRRERIGLVFERICLHARLFWNFRKLGVIPLPIVLRRNGSPFQRARKTLSIHPTASGIDGCCRSNQSQATREVSTRTADSRPREARRKELRFLLATHCQLEKAFHGIGTTLSSAKVRKGFLSSP
jgi:hypothetical protein